VADQEHAPPKFFTDLVGWYSLTTLAIGSRTGLLDALCAGPGTVDEIADRAGVDRRNALEWLRGVVAGGHAVVEGNDFALSPETAAVLGPGFPVDARAVIDFVDGIPSVLPEVADAIRDGSGVRPEVYQDAFHGAVGRVNTPTYAAALVDEWITGIPGIADRLRSGGSVADLASGNADAAAIVAGAFPAARVVGYDLVAPERDDLPPNVELVRADAHDLPTDDEFDLVMCLDSFHHFGDPVAVAGGARKLLRPGGAFLVVESGLSGDLARDAGDPFALIVFACGVLYCLQESLAAGGSGNTAGDGPTWVADALAEAGFADVTVTPSPTGYHLITGHR
jgi:SAM-dependent methyltransferase